MSFNNHNNNTYCNNKSSTIVSNSNNNNNSINNNKNKNYYNNGTRKTATTLQFGNANVNSRFGNGNAPQKDKHRTSTSCLLNWDDVKMGFKKFKIKRWNSIGSWVNYIFMQLLFINIFYVTYKSSFIQKNK